MKEVKGWTGEDYEKEYGLLDFKDKTVLDIGADYGSTACYFLGKGAKRVIAVEGNPQFFQELLANTKDDERVQPISLYVKTGSHLENLLQTHKPDITKIDCEGCEFYLMQVKNETLRMCPKYIIETHDAYEGCKSSFHPETRKRLTQKFAEAGFRFLGCKRPDNAYIVNKYKDKLRVCFWSRIKVLKAS